MSQFKFGDIVSYNGRAWMVLGVTAGLQPPSMKDQVMLVHAVGSLPTVADAEKCKLLPKQSNLAECLSQPLCVYKRGDRVVLKQDGMPVRPGIVLGITPDGTVLVSPDYDPTSINCYSQSEMNTFFDLVI